MVEVEFGCGVGLWWVLFGFFLGGGKGLGFWGVREGFVEFFCSFGGGSEV